MPAASAADTVAAGNVLVTATTCTAPGSRPTRRLLATMTRSTSARRSWSTLSSASPDKQTRLLERPLYLDEGQAHDVGERAFDPFDERRAETLDGVRARLVVRLTGLEIGG